jgi:hypothetical protein
LVYCGGYRILASTVPVALSEISAAVLTRIHEPVWHALPDADEASQVPCKEPLRVHKVFDCARFFHAGQFAM